MSDRRGAGLKIAKSSVISENWDGSFSVPSQTRKGVSYTVKVIGDAWTCICPDFVNRVGQIDECKHIIAVKFWTAAQVELAESPKPKVFAEDAAQCPKCGSIRIVRYGRADGKQVFKCRDCGRKFREELLKKSRYSPETVSLTLDLYFSGMSFNKIARTLKDHFDVSIGSATVYRWIQKFVPQISEYVDSLTPQLSETWHADELFVKMKGGVAIKTKGSKTTTNLAFLWNVMDRKTRFLLASRLSRAREILASERAFRDAIRVAHDSKPERIFTDAHKSYRDGIKYAFRDGSPQHIANAGVRKPHSNNNRIERLNGTLRERVKVQRGWKSFESKIAEGQRIHYNFVKPHQALDGQTPAQAAEVGVDARNKWLAMLKEAITRDETSDGITRR